MNDETENGTTPGIAAAVENLKAQATALAPSLTGTRSVSGWTGVAQVGAELVVEQPVEGSDAAIAARAIERHYAQRDGSLPQGIRRICGP